MPSVTLAFSVFCVIEAVICSIEAVVSSTPAACSLAPWLSDMAVALTCSEAEYNESALMRTWPTMFARLPRIESSVVMSSPISSAASDSRRCVRSPPATCAASCLARATGWVTLIVTRYAMRTPSAIARRAMVTMIAMTSQ